MKISIKVTDTKKFKGVEVDTSTLSGGKNPYTGQFSCEGTITITTPKELEINCSGQFGRFDYVEDFGFELCEAE